MTSLLLAFGLVAGLVRLAMGQKEDPSIKRFLQRRRLDFIAHKPDRLVTAIEADDAVALARRLIHDNEAELRSEILDREMSDLKKILARFTKLVSSGKLPRRNA